MLLLVWMAGAVQAQEFRALWVDAFNTGLKNASQVDSVIATARSGNFNAIVAQVRKRGDAYYRNGLEPVASDVAAGFDPLADLLAKAHDESGGKQRIEVHAWMVTYNVWNSEAGIPPQATHPYRLHPEWLSQKYRALASDPVVQWDGIGGNYLFDPGHPEVQKHIFAVSMDLLTRYPVDGLHFDYIRYPDGSSSNDNQPWGYHPVSVARFQTLRQQSGVPLPTNTNWLQWRRGEVTALLRKVWLHATALKPQTRVSAALITYGSTAPGPGANDFALQSEAYRRVLQDWNGWLQEGILDLACPMVYKTSNTSVSSWTDFIRRRQYQRASAIGLGSYLNPLSVNLAQMKLARASSSGGLKAAGLLGYSWYAVDNSGTTTTQRNAARTAYIQALTDDAAAEAADPGGEPLYASRAALPAMPWKSDSGKGHLMGFVTAPPDGTAVDGASVLLTGPVSRSLVSDGTGFYGAVDLPPGMYQIEFSAPGFERVIQSKPVTGAQVAVLGAVLGLPAFSITGLIYHPATGRAEITWTSATGQFFRVESSLNLTDWSVEASQLPAAGPSTTYVTPASSPAEPRRWWRIVRQP